MGHVKTTGGIAVAVLMLTSGCSGPSDTAAAPRSAEPSTPDPTTATPNLQNHPCEPLPDMPRGRIAYTQTRDDGTAAIAQFPGGPSDPGLRAPGIAPSVVVARPGDDLNALANDFTFVTRRVTFNGTISNGLMPKEVCTIQVR